MSDQPTDPDDAPEDVDDPTDLDEPETPETTGPDAKGGESQDPEAFNVHNPIPERASESYARALERTDAPGEDPEATP